MRTQTILKTKLAGAAVGLFSLIVALTLGACSNGNKNNRANPYNPYCVGLNCPPIGPGNPGTSNIIGFALGNSMSPPGGQLALEFFTSAVGYPIGAGVGGLSPTMPVMVRGTFFVQGALSCNLVPGAYQLNQVLQPGYLDPSTQLIRDVVVEAIGPARAILRLNYVSILSATPKLLACDRRNIPYDELVATVTIEQVFSGPYGYPCGMPLYFEVLGAPPACQ